MIVAYIQLCSKLFNLPSVFPLTSIVNNTYAHFPVQVVLINVM